MTTTDLEEGIEAHNNGDFQTALRKLEPLANNGNPEAQFYMGNMCEFGKGVPKKRLDAWNWYAHASEQGYEQAFGCLERMRSARDIWDQSITNN